MTNPSGGTRNHQSMGPRFDALLVAGGAIDPHPFYENADLSPSYSGVTPPTPESLPDMATSARSR